ncbi:MAG: hypothetical protein Q9226_002771, partial [Calogaya cf. arnoldii]
PQPFKPSTSSGSQTHPHPSEPSTPSTRPATRRLPPVELDSSPHIPGHFEYAEVRILTNYDDPDCNIYNEDPDWKIYNDVEPQLDQIIDNARPELGCWMIEFGTIWHGTGEDDYDPTLHPRVLAIRLEECSCYRWGEVDFQIRKLVYHAYWKQGRKPPPIRYYEIRGWELC